MASLTVVLLDRDCPSVTYDVVCPSRLVDLPPVHFVELINPVRRRTSLPHQPPPLSPKQQLIEQSSVTIMPASEAQYKVCLVRTLSRCGILNDSLRPATSSNTDPLGVHTITSPTAKEKSRKSSRLTTAASAILFETKTPGRPPTTGSGPSPFVYLILLLMGLVPQESNIVGKTERD